MEDLRLRFQVDGAGAEVIPHGSGIFRLSAGSWHVWLYFADGAFDTQPVAWETGSEDTLRWVDVVCYKGAQKMLKVKEISSVRIAVGFELLRDCERPMSLLPVWDGDEVLWNAIRLRTPPSPERHG